MLSLEDNGYRINILELKSPWHDLDSSTAREGDLEVEKVDENASYGKWNSLDALDRCLDCIPNSLDDVEVVPDSFEEGVQGHGDGAFCDGQSEILSSRTVSTEFPRKANMGAYKYTEQPLLSPGSSEATKSANPGEDPRALAAQAWGIGTKGGSGVFGDETKIMKRIEDNVKKDL